MALHKLERLATALGEIAGSPVQLTRPSDEAHGDYATNVALATAKEHKRPPREVAEELASRVVALPEIAKAEVAGPGFLNLWVTDAFLSEALAEIDDDFGSGFAENPERVQVELVSANPTGPLTIGSARNGAYGDAVARLLRFAGHDVTREYYFNDAGGQMDKFRDSVEAWRRGEEPPADGYVGAYIGELAKLDGDPVPHMLREIEASLERFRIPIDSWQKQSVIEGEIADAIAGLDTYEEDGALWARTSAYGDDKDRVLVRSTGEPTYFAADAAYIRHKLNGYDRAIYVLGADHHGYVARLKALAAMYGASPDRIEILIYQLVHLTRGGETVRMGKRSGNVVFLDDLVDEVGVDAARWYLVNRGPDQSLEIDLDLAAEKSAKNPVYYVQYVHARIAGIFREATEGAEVNPMPTQPLASEERELVKRLLEFPDVVREAASRRGPQGVPVYAIRLADGFHRFYHEHTVLAAKGGDAEPFRLALIGATRTVIARCLDLVGVLAPDRM